jgi:hypothetical protein
MSHHKVTVPVHRFALPLSKLKFGGLLRETHLSPNILQRQKTLKPNFAMIFGTRRRSSKIPELGFNRNKVAFLNFYGFEPSY